MHEKRFFWGSVQKYYYYVQKYCLFWGSCRNITDLGPGVPGFSCRAIFGVREEILIFRRNIHLCVEGKDEDGERFVEDLSEDELEIEETMGDKFLRKPEVSTREMCSN